MNGNLIHMKSYIEHYQKCVKQAHGPDHMFLVKPVSPEDTLGEDIDLTLEENIETSKEFRQLVKSLSLKVSDIFQDGTHIQSTSFSNEIMDTLQFPEVHEIYELAYEQLINLYKCHVTTNRIQIYQNIYSKDTPLSSWQWHYDDNPVPQRKLFVYLTDVGRDDAPFCYLGGPTVIGTTRDQESTAYPYRVGSSRISPTYRKEQVFKTSRIPDHYIRKLQMRHDAREYFILGEAGTSFVFDPNIIHRATIPKQGHQRIALVYHLHPTLEKTELQNFYNKDVKVYAI